MNHQLSASLTQFVPEFLAKKRIILRIFCIVKKDVCVCVRVCLTYVKYVFPSHCISIRKSLTPVYRFWLSPFGKLT